MSMTDRQAFALAHPLNRADDFDTLRSLTRDRRHGSGLLIRTILAVDR